MLQILQNLGARGHEVFGGPAEELFPGFGGPDEFAGGDGAGFVEEGADLSCVLAGDGLEVEMGWKEVFLVWY